MSLKVTAWLTYIQSLHSQTIDLDLTRIQQVADRLRCAFECPVVTIAGTNGKGTCVQTIVTLLKAAGWRVGSYTSPHLIHFEERIQVDQNPIDTQDLCAAFTAVEQARGAVSLTYFEFTTLAALYYFHQQNLDALILEVGLGGRLDAVRVCPPDWAVITQIDYDHMEILGSTLTDIAKEKAGILHEACQGLFTYPTVPEVVSQTAQHYQIPILSPYVGSLPKLSLPLLSVRLGIAVATELLSYTPELTELYQMSFPGRCHHACWQDVPVIVDVGHNPAAAAWILTQLPTECETIIFAVKPHKEWQKMIQILTSKITNWVLLKHPNTIPDDVLLKYLQDHTTITPLHASTMADALAAATTFLKPSGSLLVFGSFETAAAFFKMS